MVLRINHHELHYLTYLKSHTIILSFGLFIQLVNKLTLTLKQNKRIKQPTIKYSILDL